MPGFTHPLRAWTGYRRAAFGAPAPRRQFMPREVLLDLLRAVGERLPLHDTTDLPWALAERVHDPEYLHRWRLGQVTREEERALGFPWNETLVGRSLASSGATWAATRDALSVGLGVHVGGGSHHAYRHRAEGFSYLNDVAISAQWVLDEQQASRILILDLDVHQGNGTAAIFAAEARVYTVSVHAAHNYPFQKEWSDLDIALPDGTADAAYLHALNTQVMPVVQAYRPDFIYYLAGADVLQGDQLGRLALSVQGTRARDEQVCRWAVRAGVPLAIVTAGGYNRDPQKLVQARLGTLDAALEAFNSGAGPHV